MSELEQLTLLRNNVDAWNKWRSSNPVASINLYKADLRYVDLAGADLSDAILDGAYLSKADFQRCNFSGASLRKANFLQSNLRYTDFRQADLRGAYLSGVNLKGADASGADMSNAYLSHADLSNASLMRTCLYRADLFNANLHYADFRQANLSHSNLRAVQALNTDFSQSVFTGACIQDWNINGVSDLSQITCDYIYLEYGENRRQYRNRRPINLDTIFEPEEFTNRFRVIESILEIVDLTFSDGIDWQAFFRTFQKLRQQYHSLSIQALERRGRSFVVRLEVDAGLDKAEIESNAKHLYQLQLESLELQYREQFRLQYDSLRDARAVIRNERKEKSSLIGVIKTMAENQQKSKYDMRGSNFGNFIDTAQNGSSQQTIQNNYTYSDRQSVESSIKTMQHLLEQVDLNNPDASIEQKKEFITIATPKRIRDRLVGALSKGGKAAISEFLDNPYVNISIAIIEGWREAERKS